MPRSPEFDILRKALAGWYAANQRPLPWRTRPSLYRTVVSELMAQQTQIATMLPYFERWMERFPDFHALAAARSEVVLRHWEGLGYYSRARNLHRLAKDFVAMEPKPRTAVEWQALPGIGPYTAAAIGSIIFGEPTAVVDGNVVRVLSRLTGNRRAFTNNGEAVKAMRPFAQDCLDPARPGDHNQALMELGALICTKRRPGCGACPLRAHCLAYASGTVDDIPRIQRKATVRKEVRRLLVVNDRTVVLHRIPASARQLAGQFEIPPRELFKGRLPTAQRTLRRSRGITHQRIVETIDVIAPTRALGQRIAAQPELHEVGMDALEAITLSGPHRKWLNEILNDQTAR